MKNCFIEKYTSPGTYAMPLFHSHNYYEMYFLKSGSRSFYVENDSFALKENDILLVPANYLHRTEGEQYTRYLVNFNEEYLDEQQLEMVELCELQKFSLSPAEAEKIFDLLETLYSIQEDKTKKNSTYKDLNFHTCFSFLFYTLSNLKNFPVQRHQSTSSYSLRTKQIISHIQEHYMEKITLDLFCQMFFVTQHTLCTSFKKDTGISIIDFLLKTRLNKAQNMLMYSNKKIHQIAEECGFSSANYFHLIFSKHLKISPSEFRKNNKIILNYGGMK